jgi:hypothetical protein
VIHILPQTIKVETAEMLENQKKTSLLLLETLRYARSPMAEVTATHAYGTPNFSKVKIFGAFPSSAEAYKILVEV